MTDEDFNIETKVEIVSGWDALSRGEKTIVVVTVILMVVACTILFFWTRKP